MSKEIYVLKSQVHFGTLKTSVPKGAKIIIDRKKQIVEINGVEHDNISEVEMCIRAGFIIPFIEGETKIDTEIKISPKAKENKKEYNIEKSDVDSMNKDLKISQKNTNKKAKENKKDNKMEVIREVEGEEARGIKVISNDSLTKDDISDKDIMKVINGDDGEIVAKIPKKNTKPKGVPEQNSLVVGEQNQDVDVINGEQGTVVKSIGKSDATKSISSGKKLTAKRGSDKSKKDAESKAKANAEARKKASEARRAKSKESK